MDKLLADQRLAGIWESVSAALKNSVAPETYGRWFAAISLVGVSEDQLDLEVPNSIYQLWIESNYLAVMQGAIVEVLHTPKKLVFHFAESPAAAEEKAPGNGSQPVAAEVAPRPAQPKTDAIKAAVDDQKAPPPQLPHRTQFPLHF